MIKSSTSPSNSSTNLPKPASRDVTIYASQHQTITSDGSNTTNSTLSTTSISTSASISTSMETTETSTRASLSADGGDSSTFASSSMPIEEPKAKRMKLNHNSKDSITLISATPPAPAPAPAPVEPAPAPGLAPAVNDEINITDNSSTSDNNSKITSISTSTSLPVNDLNNQNSSSCGSAPSSIGSTSVSVPVSVPALAPTPISVPVPASALSAQPSEIKHSRQSQSDGRTTVAEEPAQVLLSPPATTPVLPPPSSTAISSTKTSLIPKALHTQTKLAVEKGTERPATETPTTGTSTSSSSNTCKSNLNCNSSHKDNQQRQILNDSSSTPAPLSTGIEVNAASKITTQTNVPSTSQPPHATTFNSTSNPISINSIPKATATVIAKSTNSAVITTSTPLHSGSNASASALPSESTTTLSISSSFTQPQQSRLSNAHVPPQSKAQPQVKPHLPTPSSALQTSVPTKTETPNAAFDQRQESSQISPPNTNNNSAAINPNNTINEDNTNNIATHIPSRLPKATIPKVPSPPPPLKSTTMYHLHKKYTTELQYMHREFKKLERQLLGAKTTSSSNDKDSAIRREKLHSFILHLEDTMRQIQQGCALEDKQNQSNLHISTSTNGEKSNSSSSVTGVTNKMTTTTGPATGSTQSNNSSSTSISTDDSASEEAKKEFANSSALTKLTKAKAQEENVQKLEEHILANLLPVKVRLTKQLAAQQGAARNPAGIPTSRGRSMLVPPGGAGSGGVNTEGRGTAVKGTFAAAAEQRRLALLQQQQHNHHNQQDKNQLSQSNGSGGIGTGSVATPLHPASEGPAIGTGAPTAHSQFGNPLQGRGSSITQKLHGATLGSKSRTHGHGVGSSVAPSSNVSVSVSSQPGCDNDGIGVGTKVNNPCEPGDNGPVNLVNSATMAPTKRKVFYAGMAPGSVQIQSGVSAAAGVHDMVIETPGLRSHGGLLEGSSTAGIKSNVITVSSPVPLPPPPPPAALPQVKDSNAAAVEVVASSATTTIPNTITNVSVVGSGGISGAVKSTPAPAGTREVSSKFITAASAPIGSITKPLAQTQPLVINSSTAAHSSAASSSVSAQPMPSSVGPGPVTTTSTATTTTIPETGENNTLSSHMQPRTTGTTITTPAQPATVAQGITAVTAKTFTSDIISKTGTTSTGITITKPLMVRQIPVPSTMPPPTAQVPASVTTSSMSSKSIPNKIIVPSPPPTMSITVMPRPVKKSLKDPNLTEEERQEIKKRRRSRRKEKRRAHRMEQERQRQIIMQQQQQQRQQQQQAASLRRGGKAGTGTGAGNARNGISSHRKGPKTVEYICALCNETYNSTCDCNPWWALLSHDCPKCGKTQIPRIDISSPANTIEYHPALLAHITNDNNNNNNGNNNGNVNSITNVANNNLPPNASMAMKMKGTQIQMHNTYIQPSPSISTTGVLGKNHMYGNGICLDSSGSELSDNDDDGLSMSDSDDSEYGENMSPSAKAENEDFGKDYSGPKYSDYDAARLLVLMGHAATCPGRHKSSKAGNVCRNTKFLMLHVRDCPGTTSTYDICPYPWCRKTKHLLYHLVSCTKPDKCEICSPLSMSNNMKALKGLNEFRRKKQKERAAAALAAAASAVEKSTSPYTQSAARAKMSRTAHNPVAASQSNFTSTNDMISKEGNKSVIAAQLSHPGAAMLSSSPAKTGGQNVTHNPVRAFEHAPVPSPFPLTENKMGVSKLPVISKAPVSAPPSRPFVLSPEIKNVPVNSGTPSTHIPQASVRASPASKTSKALIGSNPILISSQGISQPTSGIPTVSTTMPALTTSKNQISVNSSTESATVRNPMLTPSPLGPPPPISVASTIPSKTSQIMSPGVKITSTPPVSVASKTGTGSGTAQIPRTSNPLLKSDPITAQAPTAIFVTGSTVSKKTISCISDHTNCQVTVPPTIQNQVTWSTSSSQIKKEILNSTGSIATNNVKAPDAVMVFPDIANERSCISSNSSSKELSHSVGDISQANSNVAFTGSKPVATPVLVEDQPSASANCEKSNIILHEGEKRNDGEGADSDNTANKGVSVRVLSC